MATPRTLAQQGRLLGVDGTPLNRTVDLQVSLYGQSTGGTALFTGPIDLYGEENTGSRKNRAA